MLHRLRRRHCCCCATSDARRSEFKRVLGRASSEERSLVLHRSAQMAATRPLVTVLTADGAEAGSTTLPSVFSAPIRPDLVRFVHTNMAKNARQPYAVSKVAGHQTAAESWGTGRAVSRIPRVPGGGTHRAGQGAFGNMCRGGRMFAPTKTWRRWHRKINIRQKRHAVVSAMAASAVPALVMARGHRISQVPEIPLVLADDVESISKTKQALEILKKVGGYDDVCKADKSRNIRRGKGKMRNRRYVSRKGPLVIYDNEEGIAKAFRNIPGVDLARVDSLNLLQLAPGGHMGRFCIWTKPAFEKLDALFGSLDAPTAAKKGYKLQRNVMSNPDLARVINSDEIQSVVKAPKKSLARKGVKKNPLKNLGVMLKLNPYAKTARRAELLASKAGRTSMGGKPTAEQKAVAKAFYKQMITDSDYQNEDCEVFQSWLSLE